VIREILARSDKILIKEAIRTEAGVIKREYRDNKISI